jgi:hypothetical protein
MSLTDQIFDSHKSRKRMESAVINVYFAKSCSNILKRVSTKCYYRTLLGDCGNSFFVFESISR